MLTDTARYRVLLLVLFAVAVALRLPAVFQELPPYTFCDEDIFFGDAYRMYVEGSWAASDFRSGGFNLYPGLILAHVVSLFGPLQPEPFVILGRVLYSVLLSSATVFPVAAATRKLFGSRAAGIVAAVGFVLSPFALGVSRFWYPDHYLVFFSALLLYCLARMIVDAPRLVDFITLGALFGAALSVKYSFLLFAVPIAIAVLVSWARSMPPLSWAGRLRLALSQVVAFGVATVLVFVVLNASAFGNFGKFQNDFLFNLTNYGREGASIDGVGFYAFVLLVLSLGALGILGMVVGSVSIRRSLPTLALLTVFPAFLICYLGLQGLVINRNMMMALPFLLPLFAHGVLLSVQFARRRGKGATIAIAVVLGLLAAGQIAQIALATFHDLRPDSRILAAEWISKSIPAGSTIGTNEGCSGLSPADRNGNTMVVDPMVEGDLDYYVMNSYWGSVFAPAYHGKEAVATALDQKYLHFYYFNDRQLPLYFLEFFGARITARDLVPPGYELVKVFDSNGPDILILKRTEPTP